MEISGKSVHLRPWQPGDEGALAQLANNRSIWRNLTDQFPHPYRHEDAVTWIRQSVRRPDDCRHLAVIHDGQLVGGVGFNRLGDLRTMTAEIGYWVGEPFWGRGFATEALNLLSDVALLDYDFVRLQATVLGWNPASCRVLEKAGYEPEARLRRQGFKDGEVTDIWMYARLRDPLRLRED
jgi:RimJ/RimL family protein N-acetyltransferase